VLLDRIEEADRVVQAFSEVPPTAQWAYMSDITKHVVMVHTAGPEVSARSLAEIARESVARRPALFVDFLQGFAYSAYFRADYDRAREIACNTLPLGAGWVQTWLINQLYGITTDVDQTRREFDAEHPWSDLRAFTAEHGPRLFAEELARWS
jgi:hypothetical protein